MKIVVCGNCKASLFVSDDRAPVCGACGSPVAEVRSEITRIKASRRRKRLKWAAAMVAAAGLAGAAFYAHASMLPLLTAQFARARTVLASTEYAAPLLAMTAVICAGLLVLYLLRPRRSHAPRSRCPAVLR